jgi:hypothetical protein
VSEPSLRAVHDAAHLVMLFERGFGPRLLAMQPWASVFRVRPARTGCYIQLLWACRQAETYPLTREDVADDIFVLLAGVVATAVLHPAQRQTHHGANDQAVADRHAAAVEPDAITRRAWLTYLRHRTRAMLTSEPVRARVLATAALLDGHDRDLRAVASLVRDYELTTAVLPASMPECTDRPSEEVSELDAAEEPSACPGDAPPEPEKPLSPVIREVMELSTRAQNCLAYAGIHTVEQLERYSDQGLTALKNVGAKTCEEIIHAAERAGITIRRGAPRVRW